mgnify:CR=1 FL=1
MRLALLTAAHDYTLLICRTRLQVIERDNRILGAALLLDLGQTPDGVPVAEVGAFCVDPIYRCGAARRGATQCCCHRA